MACAAGRAMGSVNFGREGEASSWDSNDFDWHSCSWLLQLHRDAYHMCMVLDILVVLDRVAFLLN